MITASLKTLVRGGVTKEDFEREKRRFIGGFIGSFNSLEYIANHYTYYQFHEFDLFAAVALLPRVTLKSVMERLETLLDPESSTRYVIEPRA